MQISKAGLDLIYSFEGKHRALGDGRYIAYRCPAGVLTIYAGCTKGVTEGMIVTEQGGETMFRAEIERFENAVARLVTVEINQHQFDALVSFCYNCGEGALAKSSILTRLNAGDFNGAAKGFALWNKARNGGPNKPLVVMPGLVRRRAAEAALFLAPMPAGAPADEPLMPQAVELPAPKEEHAEAHAELGQTSWSYSIVGRGLQAVRWLAPTGAVGVAGKKALDGGDATAINVAPQAVDLLGQVGAASNLIAKFGLPFLAIALLLVLELEAIRYWQRTHHMLEVK